LSGRRRTATAVTVASLGLTACKGAPSTLEPSGPGAARIEGLWWLAFWVAAAVFAIVCGFLVVAVIRGRRTSAVRGRVPWGEPFVVVSGVVVPAVLLIGIYVVSLADTRALSRRGELARFEIAVTAHDWWWEASYPNGAVTANEIHIPVGEPVRLRLLSADVIHSFWVPELQGKTDLTPGREETMWLQADAPGRYRGQCAEYCGLQHANMALFVVAEPRAQFEEWLELQASPADAPSGPAARGREVFMSSTCVGCHAIEGTPAQARAGPDLTHIASRETLLAGTLANTPDNLRTTIVDPQEVKPGVAMPPTELAPAELGALVAYLETLE
jgi:cytochrome c oxidase subunit II